MSFEFLSSSKIVYHEIGGKNTASIHCLYYSVAKKKSKTTPRHNGILYFRFSLSVSMLNHSVPCGILSMTAPPPFSNTPNTHTNSFASADDISKELLAPVGSRVGGWVEGRGEERGFIWIGGGDGGGDWATEWTWP